MMVNVRGIALEDGCQPGNKDIAPPEMVTELEPR
jgi:hypothetical protein